jgi:hypothetical protein
MSDTRLEARRRVHASADRIWELVSHPAGHVRIDGSGMLEAALDAQPLVAVGDTFDMDMDREPLGDVPLGKYQVRNWVTQIESGRLIEWATNLLGNDEPVGHRYGWIIEPMGPDECDVTNYTDWSRLPPEYQSHWPIVPLWMLERSVENLERIVTSD